MEINHLLIGSIPLIVGFVVLFLFYRSRAGSIEHLKPKGAIMSDLVRWGRVGKLAMLKMGVLALYEKEIVLIDKTNTEVFRFSIPDISIEFASTKSGMNIKHASGEYDTRIDYGSVPGYFDSSKRYELWADSIKKAGGKNFITDQDAVSRVVFNPKTNRTYVVASLFMALFISLLFFLIPILT